MNRFGDIDCSFKRLTPVYGYRSHKLVSIEQALEPLQAQIEALAFYVKIAKENCHHPSEHGLTRDESAAIYIYTMEWGEQTLYRMLNRALRDENRQPLKVWFAYLKLFMSALDKLPTVRGVLWRGVPGGLGKSYAKDQTFTWWGVNSCSVAVNVINGFLGDEGRSTIFLIQAIGGKAIAKYSEFNTEEEVILPMGTRFRVEGGPLVRTSGQDVVHLVEIDEHDNEIATALPPSTLDAARVLATKYHKWNQHAKTVAGGNRQGQQLSQLYQPSGIFVDHDQSILIADSQNHRVVRWVRGMKTGTVVAGGESKGSQLTRLNAPEDVLVDERDRSIVVADRENRRVVRWFAQNTRAPQILIDNIDCQGVAMDQQGDLYVADEKKHEVRRWKEGEAHGTLVAGGCGRGKRLDQLNRPTFLFVDNEQSVYVSDSRNHRVVKWRRDTSEGVLVAGGNEQGDGLNQLSSPHGVIVDRWGQIYVADMANHRVIRLREGESEGEIIVGGLGHGQESNQLFFPISLSFDDEGNLYVVDHLNDRVQKFDLLVT